jgi:uncharacterized membrane protein (UPF0127 family)
MLSMMTRSRGQARLSLLMRTRTAALMYTMMLMIAGGAGCSPPGPGNAGSTDTGSPAGATAAPGSGTGAGTGAGTGTGAPRADQPVVILEPEGHPPAEVTVEIARTARQIQRGLMYREHMPPDHGMLFLMGPERIQSFWMRNTLISLDMIFIGKDMTVAGVVANTEPLTDTSRRVDRPSSYVLEVNAGWAAAHHVGAGTRVRFRNVSE